MGRLAVLGCGSIGQRHIRNLRTLGAEVVAFDPVPQQRHAAEALGAEAVTSLDDALVAGIEGAVVCTPPDRHVLIARRAIESGAHVFIEKPLAVTLDEVDELLEDARQARRVVAVGYNLRFHPPVQCLKRLVADGAIGRVLTLYAEFGQYLPDWRPTQDYRQGYNAFRSSGGGILLDASHEIDYARWIVGEVKAVFAVAERASDLEIEVEDVALLTLRFAGGGLGQLHLDSVQRGYARGCKLVGTAGTVIWDHHTGVRLLRDGAGWQTVMTATSTDGTYLDEMAQFVACLRGEAAPLVSGEDGRRVLEIALAAHRSARESREVEV